MATSANPFRRHRIQQAIQATPHGPSRRRFLQSGLAGALAATLPLLSACGDDDDAGDAGTDRLTLFFNYSHLDHQGKSMWVHSSRRNYRVRPVAEVPHVLERERRRNRFLAQLDDRYITHVVEGLPAPRPDVVAFQYGVTEGSDGQWSMDSVNLLLPEAAMAVAFQRLGDAAGAVRALPLSAKRRKYGLPPAQSARDLYEEQALQDTISHAATLVAMHKDMLALDGSAAGTVVHGYVMQSLDVDDIDGEITQLGTATPEIGAGKTNPNGWATLRPMLDANGQPRRIDKPGDPANGRIAYMPVLHPQVAALVGKAVTNILPGVQNDATLGADITDQPAGSSLRGVLWVRRDGRPTVVADPSAGSAASAGAMSVLWPNGQNHWLDCSAKATPQSNGTQLLEISYSNSALRYLNCFIEFYDESDKLLALGTMPDFANGTWVTSPPHFDYDPTDGDRTRIGIGSIASLGTVMGIPVFTDSDFYGSLNITLKLSEQVHRVRLYAGGLGSGSNNHAHTIAGGVAGTLIVNYILTTLFGALGAIPDLDQAFSLVLAGGAGLINAFAAGINDTAVTGNDIWTPQFWEDQGMNLLNFVLGMVAGSNDPILRAFGESLAELIGEAEAEAAIEEAIPVVGLILAVESAVAAIADIALTTTAIAQSPFTYITDLVFTHDIGVTIHPDPGDTTYPKAANLMTVVATFDDGRPHRKSYALVAPYPASLPAVVFDAAPLGGSVDIEVCFYQSTAGSDTADNILLARGSTGRVNNDANTVYALTIAEKAYPVGANTRYRHVQRSYLDDGNGHIWVKEAAPSTPPSRFPCGSAGEICQFNGITVRQGTQAAATMLGYAWRGQNPSGGGDLGQQALLNADTAGAGYAVASSALAVDGLQIAFSRNAGGSGNFYVDPSGDYPMIRGISLDGAGAPAFDGPGSNRAYGRLNLASDALLVHPSGYLLSISSTYDRFEVLRPPTAAVSDSDASRMYIAQVIGGSGTLPGRLSNVTAATITKDGTLLMLENGNNRIQAFDFGGNPVRYFARAQVPYFLPLTQMPAADGWQHLDIQADFGGLLYVLSTHTQTGAYRLSIYDKSSQLQQALSVTEGIFAARIGLDHWRDLYTLNYQPITVRSNGARPALTEPSVSLWTPALV